MFFEKSEDGSVDRQEIARPVPRVERFKRLVVWRFFFLARYGSKATFLGDGRLLVVVFFFFLNVLRQKIGYSTKYLRVFLDPLPAGFGSRVSFWRSQYATAFVHCH